MKVYIINTGTLNNDINLSFSHATLATVNDREPIAKWHVSPNYAVLIDHPVDGWILYDIGSPEDANERWPECVTNTCYHEGNKDTTMIAQLNKLGLKPEDISHVIISHMHMDHIGNIDLFKDTAEFYVTRKEAEYAFATVLSSPYPEDHGFYSKNDVLTEVKKLHYIDEECELFEGIETILLPGHTPGVMGLLLHLSNKKIILTSDALNARKNYEGTLPGVIYDSLGFFNSLNKIKKIEKNYSAEIWFGHDMKQFNNFKKIPNYYE